MELKKKKKKLIVNGRNEDPLYLKITCKCNHDSIETEYPLIDCIHCKCQEADNSIPSEPFSVNRPIYDAKGKFVKDNMVEITEITLTNCSKYGSALGWSF